MRWLTWENVGIDRMGSAWLIQRFIDPEAVFTFVPAGQTPLPEGHEAFDIPGTLLSHQQGHCTFYTLLREYKLDDPILGCIASIIDEADMVQDVMVEPVAAGLDFLCQGIRLFSQDDHLALERGHLLYDALYARLKAEQSIDPGRTLPEDHEGN
jgi:hypothetical protein